MRTKVINNTITRLLNFEKYSNFKQALEDTAIVNDFQVVLLSEDFNPLIIVETRHQITIDEAIRVGRDLASGVGDSYRFVEIGGTRTYWGAIDINSEKYYLLLVDNEGKYSNEEINMLADTSLDEADVRDMTDLEKERTDASLPLEQRKRRLVEGKKNPYFSRVGSMKIKTSFANNGVSIEEAYENLFTNL